MTTSSIFKATLGRILLVEDEPVVLRVMAEALRTAGYVVEMARDGAEGLHKFEAESWDLVITDWSMPNLSGEEMAMAIRVHDPMVAIILTTGLPCCRTMPGLFDAVLPKPFHSERLLSVVAAVISSTPLPALLPSSLLHC